MSKGNVGKKYRQHRKHGLRKHFALPGQRFGKLLVLEGDEVDFLRGGKVMPGVNVICDCGTVTIASILEMCRGLKQSCGCMQRDKSYLKLPPGIVARNTVLDGYKRKAKDRGYSWGITDDEFDRLTPMDCFYCGISPSNKKRQRNSLGEFIYNGIDRKDNSVGYEVGNVVPACWMCNQAKMDSSFEDFMTWLDRLTAYQVKKAA